jgi:hypothetical protein
VFIRAKYQSRCCLCNARLPVGHQIAYNPNAPRGCKAQCLACAVGPMRATAPAAQVIAPAVRYASTVKATATKKPAAKAGNHWGWAIAAVVAICFIINATTSSKSSGGNSYRSSTPTAYTPYVPSAPAYVNRTSAPQAPPPPTSKSGQISITPSSGWPSADSSTTYSTPRVAENGSYYGQPNANGVPKTVAVNGYFRKDGTYVRGYYRSPPYSNPPRSSSRSRR